MGYYSTGSTAIKASHSLYNVCAKQMELNRDFYLKGKKKKKFFFRMYRCGLTGGLTKFCT